MKLLDEFTTEWTRAHPGQPVITRDTNDIPHIDYPALTAGRKFPKDQTPEDVAAFALANTLTDELLDASHIVVAAPMYNWGPPSALKAWIDRFVLRAVSFVSTPTPY